MYQFQGTPNPNAVKVVCPEPLVEGSLIVTKPEDAKGNALALDLLALDGVRDLFFLNTFVTVAKLDDATWDDLAPRIEAVLKKHLE